MSREDEEVPITARVAERPSLSLSQVRQVKPRDLTYRFLAGAVTSVAALAAR